MHGIGDFGVTGFAFFISGCCGLRMAGLLQGAVSILLQILRFVLRQVGGSWRH